MMMLGALTLFWRNNGLCDYKIMVVVKISLDLVLQLGEGSIRVKTGAEVAELVFYTTASFRSPYNIYGDG